MCAETPVWACARYFRFPHLLRPVIRNENREGPEMRAPDGKVPLFHGVIRQMCRIRDHGTRP